MLTEVVVIGEWASPDDVPAAGDLVLTLSGEIRDSVSGQVVPASRRLVHVGDDGTVAEQIFATDDSDADPDDRQYRVEERLVGSPPVVYSTPVPHQPVGSRTISDGVVTGGTLTSATAAFGQDDVGVYVTSSGDVLPALTKILSVTNSQTATLDKASGRNGSGLTVLIRASFVLSPPDV